jgi:hypothetical protein
MSRRVTNTTMRPGDSVTSGVTRHHLSAVRHRCASWPARTLLTLLAIAGVAGMHSLTTLDSTMSTPPGAASTTHGPDLANAARQQVTPAAASTILDPVAAAAHPMLAATCARHPCEATLPQVSTLHPPALTGPLAASLVAPAASPSAGAPPGPPASRDPTPARLGIWRI